jgi:hypothetical protein
MDLRARACMLVLDLEAEVVKLRQLAASGRQPLPLERAEEGKRLWAAVLTFASSAFAEGWPIDLRSTGQRVGM